jgi:hypothetical protein
MSTLAEIDAELARLVEILAEPIAWHSRRAREPRTSKYGTALMNFSRRGSP